MNMERICYKFTATLSLFPSELGGRKKPIFDNYKPSFSFNSSNHVSGEISFNRPQGLHPGESLNASVQLLPSKTIRQNLKCGDTFSIHEGTKVIGTGVIKQIIEECCI
jgi:elongation factor Tu